MNRAIFIDLDGTLIKTKSGAEFPIDYDDWEIMRGILPLIRSYSDKGYIPIIVSNQGGIEAGHVDADKFDFKLETIVKEVEQYIGSSVNRLYCPFISKTHYYRKPNPGMAYKAAIELELSLRDSIMVGNQDVDAKFAKNAYIGIYFDVKDFIKLEDI